MNTAKYEGNDGTASSGSDMWRVLAMYLGSCPSSANSPTCCGAAATNNAPRPMLQTTALGQTAKVNHLVVGNVDRK